MESSIKGQQVLPEKESRPPLIASGDLERILALVLAMGLGAIPSVVRAKFIHQMSRVVASIWHRTNGGSVQRVRHHLQVLFNLQQADPNLESLVRRQLALASWNALIANLLPSLRNKHLQDLCQIEGLHHIDEIQRQNKPALLLGAHYGAYGYAIVATLCAQGYLTRLVGYGDYGSSPAGKSILYRKLYWPRLQRIGQWARVVSVDPGKESQPELREILKNKETVYLLPDQCFVVQPQESPPDHLVPIDFLDHTVYLDITGLRIAKEMSARPLVAIPVEDGFRPHVLIEPLEWACDGTDKDDIAQDLQAYMIRLEQRLWECPGLWRDLGRPDLLDRLGVHTREEPADG